MSRIFYSKIKKFLNLYVIYLLFRADDVDVEYLSQLLILLRLSFNFVASEVNKNFSINVLLYFFARKAS